MTSLGSTGPAASDDVVRRWDTRNLAGRLYQRELRAADRGPRNVRPIYGRRDWVSNLDIVNELSGHSGCVNTLSWSKSGRLLASGSDDKHINIQHYQPDDTNAQFRLSTTIATGHTANIFSVKFMPQSNDRMIVSAAGDGEVRVFDIEYSGKPTTSPHAADMSSHPRRRGAGLYDGVKYLHEGTTNGRVYRSHGERVKRIVTESSPHLFLSCAEDGTVRQWDLRLPSSAYPRPRGNASVPPPLISYKRYALDLNTISCSASQPYYIALGGAHLHCFLHDRRMLGRDRLNEAGKKTAAHGLDGDDDLLGQATRCVRKFAPHGQQKMRRTDNGHITACKISDTNPNELVVSWSGEHIYSFDIMRSPDAAQMAALKSPQIKGCKPSRKRESPERKRKRTQGSSHSLSQQGSSRGNARSRSATEEADSGQGDGVALRVSYGNGQSEDIPIDMQSTVERPDPSPQQLAAYDFARRTIKLKSAMLEKREYKTSRPSSPLLPEPSYTSALGLCATILPDMRATHADWRYPVEPNEAELAAHRALRMTREATLRFVQACGVCARALGGRLQSASANNPAMTMFESVHMPHHEGPDFPPDQQFRYDFLRAIFLWLDSGIGSLLAGFSTSASPDLRVRQRYPVHNDAGEDALEEYLVPFLLRQATSKPVFDADISPFEVDENRILFGSERDAVSAFAQALQEPFTDLSAAAEGSGHPGLSRQEALKFWGGSVARGLLRNASESLDFNTVSRAFGGTGASEAGQRSGSYSAADIDTAETDGNVASATMQIIGQDENADHDWMNEPMLVEDLVHAARHADVIGDEGSSSEDNEEDEMSTGEATNDAMYERNMIAAGGIDESMMSANEQEEEEEEEEGEEEDADDNDDSPEPDESDDDDDYDPSRLGLPRHIYRSAFDRRKLREKVEEDIPCIPHTRVYRGHCNVKTVKDVNFYGLDDDYVVSGSDDGNFFIWDRKTTKLVNILEGDGEVVNVVQGHPYEPMLAVSGIDDTIKIFSADSRARLMARMGRGVEAADASSFSSLSWPARIRGRRVPRRESTSSASEPRAQAMPDDDDDDFVAPTGLESRRKMQDVERITTENDRKRQGGDQEAFITVHDLLELMMRRRG